MITPAFNFKKWIDENRHLLKPPVGNQVVYKPEQDFIVMVVGGPNARNDYHFNETEEFFYQLEGDITVKIVDNGEHVDIPIREGDIYMLPARTPHSPRRGPNTVGLVMEVQRREGMKDGFIWYCEKCNHLLYENILDLKDIVKELPVVMDAFYANADLRTCKQCGAVMEPPKKLA